MTAYLVYEDNEDLLTQLIQESFKNPDTEYVLWVDVKGHCYAGTAKYRSTLLKRGSEVAVVKAGRVLYLANNLS